MTYAGWVRAVVTRYSSNPAILAWEPINEPRGDDCGMTPDCWGSLECPRQSGSNRALRSFFDDIGSEIRTIDPNHLQTQ